MNTKSFNPSGETFVSDAQAARLFQQGKEEIYDYMLDNNMGFLIYLTQNLHIPGADSQDIIQEARIGLYYALRDYDESKHTSFKNFASQCIIRHVYSAIKAGNRKKHSPLNYYEELGSGEDTEVYATSDPIFDLIEKEDFSILNQKIETELSENEFRVFQLYLHGFSSKEIAKNVKLGRKSVDNALQRAKKKISALVVSFGK